LSLIATNSRHATIFNPLVVRWSINFSCFGVRVSDSMVHGVFGARSLVALPLGLLYERTELVLVEGRLR